MQSILVIIFQIGLLRLSAGTYEATSSTAANVVSYLERFWPTSFLFGNVQKAFLLSRRGKIIANIIRFLGQRESKLVRKISKKLPKLFQYDFAKNFLKNVLNALLTLSNSNTNNLLISVFFVFTLWWMESKALAFLHCIQQIAKPSTKKQTLANFFTKCKPD